MISSYKLRVFLVALALIGVLFSILISPELLILVTSVVGAYKIGQLLSKLLEEAD